MAVRLGLAPDFIAGEFAIDLATDGLETLSAQAEEIPRGSARPLDVGCGGQQVGDLERRKRQARGAEASAEDLGPGRRRQAVHHDRAERGRQAFHFEKRSGAR